GGSSLKLPPLTREARQKREMTSRFFQQGGGSTGESVARQADERYPRPIFPRRTSAPRYRGCSALSEASRSEPAGDCHLAQAAVSPSSARFRDAANRRKNAIQPRVQGGT